MDRDCSYSISSSVMAASAAGSSLYITLSDCRRGAGGEKQGNLAGTMAGQPVELPAVPPSLGVSSPATHLGAVKLGQLVQGQRVGQQRAVGLQEGARSLEALRSTAAAPHAQRDRGSRAQHARACSSARPSSVKTSIATERREAPMLGPQPGGRWAHTARLLV